MKVTILMIVMAVAMIVMMTNALDPKENCAFHAKKCDYEKLKELRGEMAATFDAFAKAEFGSGSYLQLSIKVAALLAKLKIQQTGCFEMLGTPFFDGKLDGNASFVSNLKTESVTRTTRACLNTNVTSDEWKNDPCCNLKLQKTQCCKLKEVTGKRLVIDQFTDKVDNCCLNPEKTKEAIRTMRKRVGVRLSQCDEKTAEAEEETKRFTAALTGCFANLFTEGDAQKVCYADADCDTKCNLFTKRCLPPALSDNKAAISFGKCLAEKLGSSELAGFKKTIAGSSGASQDDFGAEIAKEISAEICVSKTIGWQRKSLTKTACANAQICSNGAATCTNTDGFCGHTCIEEDGKTRCAGATSLTETQCNALGFCSSGDTNISKEDCENKQFCTHPSYKDAEGSACTDKYVCLGYPFRKSKCIKKPSTSARGEVNACGSFGIYNARLQACISADVSITDSTKCANAGGTWVDPPSTKEKCEEYGLCVGPAGVPKFKTKENCGKCEGDKWVTLFNPVQAQVINGTFINYFKWVENRELYKPYKWVSAIDSTKAAVFSFKAMAKFVIPRIAAAFRCKIEPIMTSLQQVACDCGTKPQETCFQPKNATVAATQMYVGVKGKFEDNVSGNMLSLDENSCGSSQDGTTMTLTSHVHVSASAEASSSRSAQETSIAVKDKDGKIIGAIIGDGMKVSPAPAGGAELCLTINPELKVGNSAFTKVSFAAAGAEANSYVYVDLPITNEDTSKQVCSRVNDDKEYYPAKMDPKATEQDDSAAASSTFSMAVIIAIIMFSFGILA